MTPSVEQPNDDRSGDLGARLRLAAALVRAPLVVLYGLEGERARLLGAHGPENITCDLPKRVPAWRVSRQSLAVVTVVGRGPAAPETAIFPPSFRTAALISAPLRDAADVPIALLLLADTEPRPDLSELDTEALATMCTLIGELIRNEPSRAKDCGHHDHEHDEAGASLPPVTVDSAEWPIDFAGHDTVTGLPDRQVLLHSTDLAIADAARRGTGVAVAVVALDRFQRIDDWLGRAVGDGLLRQVAERILDTTSDADLVGRGTGAELLVAFTGIGTARSAVALADRLRQAVREPFHVHGYELSLTATVGLSRFPEDAGDAATLFRYAGIALHRAKDRRHGPLEQFTPELKEAVERRGEVERHLRRALRTGELLLHYQPKIDLRTRRTTGVEALIRWMRDGKLVSPAHFLPVAEESELIVPIGTWVLLHACQQMREWLDRGVPIESVSVNVSALQFARPDFVGTVERALRNAHLDATRLELEVTETSLMDDVSAAAERLSAIRALGARVSVDDFGTGYSSLAYLQKLPVDVLKIDRSFVKDLDATGPERDHARSLAQAITGLGHNLRLRVLAEGVETEAQLHAIVELGCDDVQGFYFSRPLPPDQLERHLR